MIRALIWAVRTYLAAQLLLLVAVLTLVSWLPRIGKPTRRASALCVRWALRLIGVKIARPPRPRS